LNKHTTLVLHYLKNPDKIEKGFKPIFREFGVGNYRTDIIVVDKDENLCLIEVKTRKLSSKDLRLAKKQVLKYRGAWSRLFNVLGANINIRALVALPNEIIDLGKYPSYVDQQYPINNLPNDVPRSKEIFGLKHIQTLQNLKSTNAHEKQNDIFVTSIPSSPSDT